MAHFYGILQGSRGEVSRLGTKTSGIHATLASWNGAISVELQYSKEKDSDIFVVRQKPWQGHGVSENLVAGTIGEISTVLPEHGMELLKKARDTLQELADGKVNFSGKIDFSPAEYIQYDDLLYDINKFLGE